MSADEGIDRKRRPTRPVLPPGLLADLKDALYGMYLSAGAPTMKQIRDRIDALANSDVEASDPTATPSVDTVHKVLISPTLPSNVLHVIAVAAALTHPHDIPGVIPVVRGHPRIEEIRRLWERAAVHVPPGRLITDIPVADLEVRRSLTAKLGEGPLPDYISRRHDHVLRDLASAALSTEAPRSGIAVLVNDSTSGKTRALFEALHYRVLLGMNTSRVRTRSLADAGWRMWPPRSPFPAERFLAELAEVCPRTVIWLNEAQRYLIDPDERVARDIAAGLRALLADPARTPVLVLGTLWPLYLDQITNRSRTDCRRYDEARALLAGHTIPVEGSFTGAALAAARASNDTRVRAAVATADQAAGTQGSAIEVQLTQHMAGVPALRDFIATASTTVTAVLRAAMDARRCGHGEWIPIDLIHHAAPAYLNEHEQRHHLGAPDWFARALDTLTSHLEASTVCALHRSPVLPGQPTGDVVRLEDYLDQYGRTHHASEIPPARFWTAASSHADPADLNRIGHEAWSRGLYRSAAQILKNAVTNGNTSAIIALVGYLYDVFPDDHQPARWAVEHVPADAWVIISRLLTVLHENGASDLVAELAQVSTTHAEVVDTKAMSLLLSTLHHVRAGDQFNELVHRVAHHASVEDSHAVIDLLNTLHKAGAREQIDQFAQRVVADTPAENIRVVRWLQHTLQEIGALEHANALLRRVSPGIPTEDPEAATWELFRLYENGARERGNELATRTVVGTQLGDNISVDRLQSALRGIGVPEQAEKLAQRTVEHAHLDSTRRALAFLDILHRAGVKTQVDELAHYAANYADSDHTWHVGRMLSTLREVDVQEQAETFAWHAANNLPAENLDDVAGLLIILLFMDARDPAIRLAHRAATHARVDNTVAVSRMLNALHQIGAQQLAGDLACRAAPDATTESPYAVGRLLLTLHHSGAHELAAELARRAAHEAIVDTPEVVDLLEALRDIGADDRAAELVKRAAAQDTLDDSNVADWLLGELEKVGAYDELAVLINRLPAAGLFDMFLAVCEYPGQFRFGRERSGKAAPAWTWKDLN